MDRLGVSLAHCESECRNFYDAAEVERVFYPEIEELLLEFFPGAPDVLVYNHDIFDKDYAGDRTEDQDNKNPRVNANYVNLVHNDLNDNSGRVRCRELLTKNLRNFGREQRYTEAEADMKMSRRFMSINLAKPMKTVGQFPFVLCACPPAGPSGRRRRDLAAIEYRELHEFVGERQCLVVGDMLLCLSRQNMGRQVGRGAGHGLFPYKNGPPLTRWMGLGRLAGAS